MLPLAHLFLGLIFVIILKFLASLTIAQLTIIFASLFLIDIDHWFVYLFKKRDFNPVNAYRWFLSFQKLKKKPKFLCIFHTIEFFILMILLSLKYQIFQFILIGALFHLCLDITDSIIRKEYKKEVSLIYSIIKWKTKRA